MMRILIRNGVVITVDARRRVYPNGFVTVEGARITAVGSSERCPAPSDFDEVIDAPRSVVVPGLINMHQHHWYTLFKGIADGLPLEGRFSEHVVPVASISMPATQLETRIAGSSSLTESGRRTPVTQSTR
jgi:5-methylthioadenosine/S-adenosylhomocysteine deaminase